MTHPDIEKMMLTGLKPFEEYQSYEDYRDDIDEDDPWDGWLYDDKEEDI